MTYSRLADQQKNIAKSLLQLEGPTLTSCRAALSSSINTVKNIYVVQVYCISHQFPWLIWRILLLKLQILRALHNALLVLR